jgi:outer membrane murein-binding lipoprotein Lpp
MEAKKRKIVRFFAVTVVSVLLLGGCASDGTLSTQKITTGEKAIMEAREGNATLTAAGELNAAEQNLTQAREAYAKKEYEKATRLADRASIDAEYARNKATTEKAKKRVEEMRGNIDALRQEIDRLSKQ